MLQVWLKKGWDSKNVDGVFVQLESRKVRKMWFVPYTAKQGARYALRQECSREADLIRCTL